MDSLIKFTMLFDTLSETEKHLFNTNFIKCCGINFIKTVLFTHFSTKILSKKAYEQNDLKSINNIVSEIIHSRKPFVANDVDTENEDVNKPDSISLDDLAAPLISNIASFLPCQDYTHTQKVNRRIYIGTNTPHSLQKLSLIEKRTNYWRLQGQSLLPNKFMQLKSLEIKMGHFNQFINPMCNHAHFLNLEKLTTTCSTDAEMTLFLTQNCIDFSKIEYLHVKDIGDCDENDELTFIDGKLFLKFVSKFKNLKQLDQTDQFLVDDTLFDPEQDIPFLSKLRAISIVDEEDSIWPSFIHKHSKQIESFSGCGTEFHLPKLKELAYYGGDKMEAIAATTTLEMISLKFFKKSKDVENVVSELLNNQLNLEFIEVVTQIHDIKDVRDWIEMLSGIEKGVPCTNKTKLHLRLQLYNYAINKVIERTDVDAFVKVGRKLFTKLVSFVDNFIIDFRCKKYENVFPNDMMEQILMHWKDDCGVVVNHYLYEDLMQIVITKGEYEKVRTYQTGGLYIE